MGNVIGPCAARCITVKRAEQHDCARGTDTTLFVVSITSNWNHRVRAVMTEAEEAILEKLAKYRA